MALMKRANREINVPENLVEEYLDKGYSLIDSHGAVLKASNPHTIEDFRGLVASLKDKVTGLEAEKATLLEEREVMQKHIEELTAELAKKTKPPQGRSQGSLRVGGLMAYIDTYYYQTEFHGTPIPDSQFTRLESIASDLIDSIVPAPIIVADLGVDALALLQKACAYQVEHLFNLGGVDAINGMSGLEMASEHLGSYSVSNANGSSSSLSVNGIPFSTMTKALLSMAGLMSRWVYKGTRIDNG